MKGSITLEGSLIFPMTIFISILLILYSFFLHDRLVTAADGHRILINDYTASSPTKIADIEDFLNKHSLLSHIYNISYQPENNHLKIFTETVDLLEALYPYNISQELSFSCYQRCSFIRKYYAIIHLTNNRKE